MQVLNPLGSLILLSVPLLWFYFVVHKIKPARWPLSLLYAMGCLCLSYFVYFLAGTNPILTEIQHIIFIVISGFSPPLIILAVSAICAVVNMSILRSWNRKAFFLLLGANIPLSLIGLVFCVMNAGQANL